MANFSTNQARHFYYMGSFGENVSAVTAANAANGILAVGSAQPSTTKQAAGETHQYSTIYFVAKNADGKIVRSDNINVGCVDYISKQTAAELATPLMMHTITLNDGSMVDKNGGDAVALDDLKGNEITLNVVVRQFLDEDPRSSIGICATYKVPASATESDIYKNLALNIVKAVPSFAGDGSYPMFKVFLGTTEVTKTTLAADLSGTYTSIVLVEAAQKYRRDLISNSPFPFDVYFTCSDEDFMVWGVDKVAKSNITGNTVIGDGYKIADLEYFCVGERGDIYRMKNWPNNWEYTYQVDPTQTYDMLTVQYHWKGHAENIQKSPKTIHIAGSHAAIESLYSDLLNKAGLAEASSTQNMQPTT